MKPGEVNLLCMTSEWLFEIISLHVSRFCGVDLF